MRASHVRRLPRAAALLAGAVVGVWGFAATASGQFLVARYEFEDPNNLGADTSGNGNDLTVVGDPAQTAGQPNRPGTFGVSFSGENDVLRRDSGLANFDGQPGLTYAAWVNHAPNGSFSGIVSQDAGGCCNYRLLLDPSSNAYINTGAHQDISNAGNVPADQWHHVVMTVQDNGDNSRTAFVYVDGQQVSGPHTQTPGVPNAALFNTYVGAGEAGATHLFNGSLDDVRIYDGALSSAQVLELYNSTIPEPAGLGLLALGLGAAGLRRRRRGR